MFRLAILFDNFHTMFDKFPSKAFTKAGALFLCSEPKNFDKGTMGFHPASLHKNDLQYQYMSTRGKEKCSSV